MMRISINGRSDLDALSVEWARASRLFKRKISVYELLSFPLMYIDESDFFREYALTAASKAGVFEAFLQ